MNRQYAVLSTGGPRDSAINFDTYGIQVYSGIALFLCHSMALLYTPT